MEKRSVYRRRVEALEEAFKDETPALLAAEALRGLIDAILVHSGERRGEVTLSMRGDLAAFLEMAEQENGTPNAKSLGCVPEAFVVQVKLDAGTGLI